VLRFPEYNRLDLRMQSVCIAILIIGIAMPNVDDYVTDTLMRDLVGHDKRPVSFLVYLWLAAEQQRRDEAVQISYQELAELIGVSKSSGQTAVGWLVSGSFLPSARRMRRRRLFTRCRRHGGAIGQRTSTLPTSHTSEAGKARR